MVYQQSTLDATFHALADPTRRQMLECLTRADATISQLARPFRMSLPAASKHVRVLQSAGLVEQRQVGRARVCRLVAGPLQSAAAWLAVYQRFWEGQLDSLERFLEGTNTEKESPS
jgi:DNA-binding transcriptional ArsR family regulator